MNTSRATSITAAFFAASLGFAKLSAADPSTLAKPYGNTVEYVAKLNEIGTAGSLDDSTTTSELYLRRKDYDSLPRIGREFNESGTNYETSDVTRGDSARSAPMLGGGSQGKSAIGSSENSSNFQDSGSGPIATFALAKLAADPIAGTANQYGYQAMSAAVQAQNAAEQSINEMAQRFGYDEAKLRDVIAACLAKKLETGGNFIDSSSYCLNRAIFEAGDPTQAGGSKLTFSAYVFDRESDRLSAIDSASSETVANFKEEFLDYYGDYETSVTQTGQAYVVKERVVPARLQGGGGLAYYEVTRGLETFKTLNAGLHAICEARGKNLDSISKPATGGIEGNCDLSSINANFNPLVCPKAPGVVKSSSDSLIKISDFTFGEGSLSADEVKRLTISNLPSPTLVFSRLFSAIEGDLRSSDFGSTVKPAVAGLYCSDLDNPRLAKREFFRDAKSSQLTERERMLRRVAQLYAKVQVLQEMVAMEETILRMGAVANNKERVIGQLQAIFQNVVAPDLSEAVADPRVGRAFNPASELRSAMRALKDTVIGMGKNEHTSDSQDNSQS